LLFQVVNLTFIAATQNVLLLLLGLPTMTASTLQPHTALASSDITLASLALIVLALEFTSDNQQYSFQTYKYAFLASENGKTDVEPYDPVKQWPGSRLNWTPEDARRGFVTKGLWAYVRHPNFACEQTFWVCFHHFSFLILSL
jgi:steroid 5-alpha reductase family enzyme